MTNLLAEAFIYLAAAVVAVPVAQRLGLGSVLGYLLAGIAIGPVFGLVGAENTDIQHFAEFGVVMMLFLVGLELQPSTLWTMRRQLAGLGGLQVLGTTAVLAGAAMLCGVAWRGSVVLGMVLALSSTAIVLQTLNEKGWMRTAGGQSSFAVLLTQDIAVIPMLALLPLLAVSGADGTSADLVTHSALADLPGWMQALAVLGAIVAIIVGGRYLTRPVFRFIAESRLREVFTAAALTLVIGIALLMQWVGLSPALGTFLAGVVLSQSDYRHELESDIEPFKGLLLGLFFLTVGADIDFGLLAAQPWLIAGLAVGVLAIKATVLRGLASAFGLSGADGWLFTLGLAQAGEFAFVLFSLALASGALAPALVELLTLVVALTMLVTPLLFALHERVVAPRVIGDAARAPDDIRQQGPIVVAGMGRFGQVVTRFLLANGHEVVVLDHDPGTIDNLARVGLRTWYGDATRPDLLHAAGLESACLFVAAIDDRERLTTTVAHVARHYPHLQILARARDRHHVYELEAAGAHVVERELFEGSLRLGQRALEALGTHPFRALRQARFFRRHDEMTLGELRERWMAGGFDQGYLDAVRAHRETLTELMRSERDERVAGDQRGWTPPPADRVVPD